MAVVSVAIAGLSLAISLLTAWLTLFKRGRLAMTKPTVVFLGFDHEPQPTAKVFLRSLLYSTSVRGQVVEAMFAKVVRGETEEIFGFWGYGEMSALVAGSGLFVGQTGVAVNHHFVRAPHQPAYAFLPGEYRVEVFARVVGQKKPIGLTVVQLSLSEQNAEILARHDGVLFELEHEGRGYVGHARDPLTWKQSLPTTLES